MDFSGIEKNYRKHAYEIIANLVYKNVSVDEQQKFIAVIANTIKINKNQGQRDYDLNTIARTISSVNFKPEMCELFSIAMQTINGSRDINSQLMFTINLLVIKNENLNATQLLDFFKMYTKQMARLTHTTKEFYPYYIFNKMIQNKSENWIVENTKKLFEYSSKMGKRDEQAFVNKYLDAMDKNKAQGFDEFVNNIYLKKPEKEVAKAEKGKTEQNKSSVEQQFLAIDFSKIDQKHMKRAREIVWSLANKGANKKQEEDLIAVIANIIKLNQSKGGVYFDFGVIDNTIKLGTFKPEMVDLFTVIMKHNLGVRRINSELNHTVELLISYNAQNTSVDEIKSFLEVYASELAILTKNHSTWQEYVYHSFNDLIQKNNDKMHNSKVFIDDTTKLLMSTRRIDRRYSITYVTNYIDAILEGHATNFDDFNQRIKTDPKFEKLLSPFPNKNVARFYVHKQIGLYDLEIAMEIMKKTNVPNTNENRYNFAYAVAAIGRKKQSTFTSITV